jgi:hypothetical protein
MAKKRLLLAIPLLLVALGGGLALVPRLLWGDGIDYSSVASIKNSPEYQNAALLEKAWSLPVAKQYQAAGIDYQHNGSFCGPTSAVDVLRSLGRAADQATILDGSGLSTWFGLLPGGLTLDQLAELVRNKSGRTVTVLRDLDLAAFRAELAHANDPARRYIVNFHRGPLFGRGGGHHSPIAGYLADEDLVLVEDVNRTFRPWLVRSDRLFSAVDTVDRQSKKKRGLLRIE